MTWFRIKSFFFFLFNSTNQHGIHPPFLYQFVTKCLYKRISNANLKRLKENRKSILNSNEMLNVQDFGAGSKKMKKITRTVAEMGKKSGMLLHQSKLMNKIVDYFKVESVLELGTSVGLGSIAMATNSAAVKIDTVEACTNTSRLAKSNLEALNLDNIQVHNKEFQSFLNSLNHQKKFDLIYIDGNHQKEATLSYFKQLKQHIHQNSILIFDDIYWSPDMLEAWQGIIKDKDVKLSIDLYFWGIIFFKPELTKQHFRIRCFY